eukprot:NODE_8261_length_1509_cov_13.118669.p1 GENE.NODE_8261_length_1509_cov_13.118669~~NODE_8261_length_1509_cov_13.118669.p1  ORF type:complete len:334 (+),score=101.61 NODE_8261_length_1509_cov_13.118669:98-1099(+)
MVMGRLAGIKHDLTLVTFTAWYLGMSIAPFFLPGICYLFWNFMLLRTATVLAALVVIDYMIPLPHASRRAMEATDVSASFRHYFPQDVISEADDFITKERNYLMCYHPHSLFGLAILTLQKHFRSVNGTCVLWTAVDIVLMIPFLRRVLVAAGGRSSSASSLHQALRKPYPYNITLLIPGGVAEMYCGADGEEQLVLARRSGFCRIALQTGASLLPVYVLGANDAYTRYFGPRSLAARISKSTKIALSVWTDRFGIPLGPVPHRSKMLVLIGKPLDVERVEEPSNEQVLELHARYIVALNGLFERHKAKLAGYESKTLLLETGAPASEHTLST